MLDKLLNLFFTVAYAQTTGAAPSPVKVPGIGGDISVPSYKYANLIEVFNGLLDAIFWTAGVLAVIAVVATGIIMATSWGNPEKMVAAKKNLLWAILGMAIFIFSYAIVAGLSDQFRERVTPPSTPTPPTAPPGLPNPPAEESPPAGGAAPTSPYTPPSFPSIPGTGPGMSEPVN